MKVFLSGGASKFLVALMGTVLTGLGTYYGGTKWEPIAAAAISTVLVFLVPNSTPVDPPK